MEDKYTQSPIRSSKRIKKNYKNLQTFNVSEFEISSQKKTKKSQKKQKNQFQPFQNISFYPKPIQGMIKLKSQLSMLDINTISSVIQTPSKFDFDAEIAKIQKASQDQENMIKQLEKDFSPPHSDSKSEFQQDFQNSDTKFQLKKSLKNIQIQVKQSDKQDDNLLNLKKQIADQHKQQQLQAQRIADISTQSSENNQNLFKLEEEQDFFRHETQADFMSNPLWSKDGMDSIFTPKKPKQSVSNECQTISLQSTVYIRKAEFEEITDFIDFANCNFKKNNEMEFDNYSSQNDFFNNLEFDKQEYEKNIQFEDYDQILQFEF